MARTISAECTTTGCKNRVHLNSYWSICIDCYSNVPDHIPIDQVNLYVELKEQKNGYNKD